MSRETFWLVGGLVGRGDTWSVVRRIDWLTSESRTENGRKPFAPPDNGKLRILCLAHIPTTAS